jgi:hypothetical protein
MFVYFCLLGIDWLIGCNDFFMGIFGALIIGVSNPKFVHWDLLKVSKILAYCANFRGNPWKDTQNIQEFNPSLSHKIFFGPRVHRR